LNVGLRVVFQRLDQPGHIAPGGQLHDVRRATEEPIPK
jgi:hypothetical protein